MRWLGLKPGVDFGSCQDLSPLFSVYSPRFRSYSRFSQRHVAKCVLGVDGDGPHDAAADAVVSMRLLHEHRALQAHAAAKP